MEEEARENCIVWNFVLCIVLHTSFRCEEERIGRVGSRHGKWNACTLGSDTPEGNR
jgi:hypothetical protein